MNGWPRLLAKLLPLAAEGLVVTLIVTPLHEFWHAVTANILGAAGYVEYQLFSGHFWFSHPEQVADYDKAIVWAAGGLGTALCFGLMWLCAAWEGHYSKWEIDEQVVFGSVTIFQMFYGITEGLSRWMDANWGYYIGVPVAIGMIGWLYMRRFINWLEA